MTTSGLCSGCLPVGCDHLCRGRGSNCVLGWGCDHLGHEIAEEKKRQLTFQSPGLWHPTALPSDLAGASGPTAVKSDSVS